MLHGLQLLFVLADRLIESAGRMLSIEVRTITNAIDESAAWTSPWDSLLDHLHWAPISAVVLATASFAGFLLLVRYLQSANRLRRDSYAPHLLPKPDLSALDIFVSVATALIGLTVCWVTG
jgi:hypothetical protein